MKFSSFALAALSLGTAFAAPAAPQANTRDLAVVQQATQQVTTVETTVVQKITQITTVVSTTKDVDVLRIALKDLSVQINVLLGDLNPVLSLQLPLITAELLNLPGLLQHVLLVVQKVVNVVGVITGQLTQGKFSTASATVTEESSANSSPDLVKVLQPELQLVLGAIKPVQTLVVPFGNSVASQAGSQTIEITQILSITAELDGLLSGLLNTLLGIVGALL
ncbi:hypothetical protein F4775DRAFT_602313 [Biscogniauxia sp. FL1348]|nr:hypothetical protein F4775DRAFT_602313 [Biscogniauxia sp. FL1348]